MKIGSRITVNRGDRSTAPAVVKKLVYNYTPFSHTAELYAYDVLVVKTDPNHGSGRRGRKWVSRDLVRVEIEREGDTWACGWDTKAADALRVACALGA